MPANEKLAERIARGDREAETLLFRQIGDKIALIVRSRLSYNAPPEDVKDIVADVKKSLLEALRQGRYDSSQNTTLSTYIVGIAQNSIAQYFRKKKRNREMPTDNPPEREHYSREYLNELASIDVQKKLRKIISRLKPKYQKILIMSFYEKKSTSEIAQTLGLDNKQVIDCKHYALKKLAGTCKKDDFFPIFSILLQILM